MKWFVWVGDPQGGYGKRDLNFANYLREQDENVTTGGHVRRPDVDVFFPKSSLIPKRLIGLQELSALKKISSDYLDLFDVVYGKFFCNTKSFKVARGIGDIETRNKHFPTTLFNTYIDGQMLKALNNANLVVSISPDETSWLKRQGITNIVDSSNFYDPTVFKQMNLKKTCDVLFVGRNDPIKNLHNLREACKKLNRQLTEISSDNWTTQEDLCKEYNQARITVLPSFYETFGSVILESLACGTPVICGENVVAGKILKNSVIRTTTEVGGIRNALQAKPAPIRDLTNFQKDSVLKKEHAQILEAYEKKG